MKHKRFNLKVCALAALIAGFSGVAIADDRQAELDAQAQAAAELAAVANDRFGTIDGILAIVEPMLGDRENNDGWKVEFTAALEGATDEQLLAIQDVTSYDAVRAILQGRDAPVSMDGVIGTEALGDLNQDLVFTPVVPCRFFDTRFDAFGGPGGGNPGTILNYHVYGTAATLTPQGHIAGTGCPAPKGEPVAISANFTVVPYGQGHIRVWPYLATQPTASFLNYNSTANTNLANAGIVATCYLCGSGGQDISVSTWFGSSDSLGDVMGYFYPVNNGHDATYASGAVTSTPLQSDNVLRFVGPTITRTVSANDEIFMVANQSLGASSVAATNLNIFPCSQISTATTPTFLGGGILSQQVPANTRIPINISGVFTTLSGTYQFGMCYRTTSSNWNNNEWGYVSVIQINKP